MNTIRLIYKNFPMWMKAVISSSVFLQFVGYLVMQFAKNETIALSTKNIFYIIGATIAFGVVGIFIGTWRVISSSQSQIIEKHTNLKGAKFIAPFLALQEEAESGYILWVMWPVF